MLTELYEKFKILGNITYCTKVTRNVLQCDATAGRKGLRIGAYESFLYLV